MSTRGRFASEVDQIESIAETKGIDLDDIEVRETESSEGDELIVFRIYETHAESEEDSVGVQVSKMPSVQTGDMTFRNDVQNKLNSLKRHLAGEQPSEQVDDEDVEQTTNSDETDQRRSRARTSTSSGGPGSQLDAEIDDLHDRLDDLEERVEAIEDKAEALDGLKQLIGDDE